MGQRLICRSGFSPTTAAKVGLKPDLPPAYSKVSPQSTAMPTAIVAKVLRV